MTSVVLLESLKYTGHSLAHNSLMISSPFTERLTRAVSCNAFSEGRQTISLSFIYASKFAKIILSK